MALGMGGFLILTNNGRRAVGVGSFGGGFGWLGISFARGPSFGSLVWWFGEFGALVIFCMQAVPR
jgi:hypothetical protein